MMDFLLLVFLIVLMISLYAMLVSFRQRSRDDKMTYYTSENTEAEES